MLDILFRGWMMQASPEPLVLELAKAIADRGRETNSKYLLQLSTDLNEAVNRAIINFDQEAKECGSTASPTSVKSTAKGS